MTQPLEGAAVLASLAEFWGRPATLAAPQPAGIRPRPGGQASGAPPRPPPLRRPRCGLETFPAPAPAPAPTQVSQLELVELEAGSALPGAPTRLPRQPGVGSPPPPPRLTSGKPRRQEPREVRPGGGHHRRGARALLPSPSLPARLRGCPGAAGLSPRCLPTQLPMLDPQPGPMHRRRRAGQLLRTPVPDSGARGQRLLPSVIGRSPTSPLGFALPRRRLRHKLCG